MLSDNQIEELFKFCKKHYVYYYDVQIELVDHLANAIEIEMEKNKNLSFELALQKVYQQFGVLGFSNLVSEKVKQSERYNIRLFWKLYKSQFGWPQIIVFLTLNLVFISLIKTFPNSFLWVFLIPYAFSSILYTIKLTRFHKLVKSTGKKFVILNLSWIGIIQLLPFYTFNFTSISFPNVESSLFLNITLSVALSLYFIATIAVSQTIDSAIKNLKENYPEVFSFN